MNKSDEIYSGNFPVVSDALKVALFECKTVNTYKADIGKYVECIFSDDSVLSFVIYPNHSMSMFQR